MVREWSPTPAPHRGKRLSTGADGQATPGRRQGCSRREHESQLRLLPFLPTTFRNRIASRRPLLLPSRSPTQTRGPTLPYQTGPRDNLSRPAVLGGGRAPFFHMHAPDRSDRKSVVSGKSGG